MNGFREAIGVILANRRPDIAFNALYYGLVLCGMIIAGIWPGLQEHLMARMRDAFEAGLFKAVSAAYRSGNFPLAALLTFVVNSALGAFAVITLPSAVIPFAGCFTSFVRASMWGLMLSPTNPRLLLVMLPHSVVLLLEGQGYVLAAFGGYLWGKWLVRPESGGLTTHGEGYRAGLRANLALYRLILPVLAVAAVYEAEWRFRRMTPPGPRPPVNLRYHCSPADAGRSAMASDILTLMREALLSSTPLTCSAAGGFSALAALAQSGPAEQLDLESLRRALWVNGLRSLTIVSPESFENGVTPPPGTRLALPTQDGGLLPESL
jgi:hypothetical protein